MNEMDEKCCTEEAVATERTTAKARVVNIGDAVDVKIYGQGV